MAELLIRVINHLIAGESWASERLQKFAGRQLEIVGTPLPLCWRVGEDGLFLPGAPDVEPAVTLTLPDDFAARWLVDRDSLFSAVRIAGAADLAETLGMVFRHLRWDAEADLAPWIGDIAARRLVMTGQSFVAWQSRATSNLVGNLAEYATEEADWLAPKAAVRAFVHEVDTLRDDVARLEKRLKKLQP